MRKMLVGALVAGALLVGAAPAGTHAAGAGKTPILGIVPHTGAAPFLPGALGESGYGPLAYHGGPVMRTNTTYAIYWFPSGSTVSSRYESLINSYFASVAAASGTNGNVYSVATQYYDTTGPIAYASTFGDYYVDTDAFPTSGCDDGVDPVCLTDDQLQAEIQHVIASKGWPEGMARLFFIMTPDQVGICTDGTATYCTSNTFCAYHSAFNDSSTVVYAVEPYDATIGGGLACFNPGEQGKPNNDDADVTINTISHEHNEAISDPLGNAWWADDGYGDEMADLCGWEFGAALGGTAGVDAYNQVINGHHYSLQMEYSNDNAGCLQSYIPPVPAESALPAVSGTLAVGKTLTTTNGTWTHNPTTYAYEWLRCASDGNACTTISGATAATYPLTAADGGYTIRSAVSAHNAGGTSAYVDSAASGVVVPLPAATTAPGVSGVTVIGKTLTTTTGSWNSTVTVTYQWLRCGAGGSTCKAIPGATSTTYVLSSSDVGHKLVAQVTATNIAGTTATMSQPSALVVAKPQLKKKPHISGATLVGHKLSAGKGTWHGYPAKYRYQWLRCNAQGGSCLRIAGATKARYRLQSGDVGHRLRARVTALNAAGRGQVVSSPSRVVLS